MAALTSLGGSQLLILPFTIEDSLVRFQVPTEPKMKIVVPWDVTPFILVELDREFRGFPGYGTLKTEAA